jgi:hypothetical protein
MLCKSNIPQAVDKDQQILVQLKTLTFKNFREPAYTLFVAKILFGFPNPMTGKKP